MIRDSDPLPDPATWLTVTFSDGNFKALGKPTKPSVVTTEESPAEETHDQQDAPPTKPIYRPARKTASLVRSSDMQH